MPDFYFAYGSNMNSARMRARGLDYEHCQRGRLPGFALQFNKRAHNKTGVGYANIGHAPGHEVQGVLYQLARTSPITVMDPYEGSPVRYSRELFEIITDSGGRWAWVYVANPAFIDPALGVEENYLNHLLSAGDMLSLEYRQRLQSLAPVIASSAPCDGEQGLRFNV